jgi:hypothetical protein
MVHSAVHVHLAAQGLGNGQESGFSPATRGGPGISSTARAFRGFSP